MSRFPSVTGSQLIKALRKHGILPAGDWTDTGLPATLEGAVASGFACAGLVPGL